MATVITRLPISFIGKAPSPIKCRPRGKPDFHQLPFVADGRVESASPYWHIPASGGYFGGYETGEAMAHAFLKFLREEQSTCPTYWMTGIVESFMIHFESEGGLAMQRRRASEWSDEFTSFRGQYTGFINTLSQWLTVAAKQLGSSLDSLTEQDMVNRANAGLGFDHVAYRATLSDEE